MMNRHVNAGIKMFQLLRSVAHNKKLFFPSDCSKTRKGRNSVTFAEMIATTGVDNMTGLSITAPEQGVVEYPDWLTSLENTRYQHSFIPLHH
jgi:hypothetical protein